MVSANEMFKQTSSATKRTYDSVRDPSQVHKVAKLRATDTARHANTELEQVIEQESTLSTREETHDGDYGPELPLEADDVEDEEGRFFGGGITKHEAEIFDFVDGADAIDEPEKIDASWLRKAALNLEKHITKNAQLRAKFETDPQRFISSEADLDTDIKGFSILSEHPSLYPELVRLGSVRSLVSLLAHDNTDIAIGAIEILRELTDEDVAAEESDWNELTSGLLDAGLPSLLVSNLTRLNEEDESDRNGVFHSLSLLENLCSLASGLDGQSISDQDLLRWLLARLQKREDQVTQNKQYAAEVLALISQASYNSRRKLIDHNAVDLLLQLVASYRRNDPAKGSEEEEFMENLFESLTCLIDESEGKAQFMDGEGVELCLLMLKDGKMSKLPALRLLEHATTGRSGVAVCQRVIVAGGLKTTFSNFTKSSDPLMLEKLVVIFASMLRLLPADQAERIRLLAKFMEKDYEKITKLLRLRRDYSSRINRVQQRNEAEQQSSSVDEPEDLGLRWLSRKIDSGLCTLQTIDVILAWLVAEDGGAKRKVQELLALQDETLREIEATISEQIHSLDAHEEDGKDIKDMLGTLVQFLH